MDLGLPGPGLAGNEESQSLQMARSSRGQRKPAMRTFDLRRRAVPLGPSGPGLAAARRPRIRDLLERLVLGLAIGLGRS
jgi:hypothetical protein